MFCRPKTAAGEAQVLAPFRVVRLGHGTCAALIVAMRFFVLRMRLSRDKVRHCISKPSMYTVLYGTELLFVGHTVQRRDMFRHMSKGDRDSSSR